MIKTIEMEVVLMEHFGVRMNLIVPNVSWGIGNLHECDLLVLSKSNYATEIEIKVSRSDLLKDKDKRHHHQHRYIKQLYFAVPEKLKEVALSSIPERAGLITVREVDYYGTGKITLVPDVARKPIPDMRAHRWDDSERLALLRLGAMRILPMKRKTIRLMRKHELLAAVRP